MLKALPAIWIAAWVLTWPALLADWQSIGDGEFAASSCRHELGAAMGVAILPPVWVVTPFMTGFYEHGLKFSCP